MPEQLVVGHIGRFNYQKNHEFSFFNKSTIKLLKDKLKETTHLNPEVDLKIYAQVGKQKQRYHLQASTR